MAWIRLSTTLTQPPDQVFPWVSRPELLPQWMTGLISLKWGRLPPDAVGRTFVLIRRIAGRPAHYPAEVTAWQPDVAVHWRILQDQLTVDRHIDLSPHGQGTQVTLALQLTPVTLLTQIGLPLFRREARQRLGRDMKALTKTAAQVAPKSGLSGSSDQPDQSVRSAKIVSR